MASSLVLLRSLSQLSLQLPVLGLRLTTKETGMETAWN
jgi:hypothetical protein